MKNQGEFPATSLLAAALVAAVVFISAALATAQTDSISSTPATITFHTLVNFSGANGADPGRPPIQGRDGNLYGTASNGGAFGKGVIFKMTPKGALTLLYSFCPETGCADGSTPGALTLGADGNFYGVTLDGGAFGYGTVFKFTGRGTPTTLHSFDNTDGRSPGDKMVQVGDGNFYGTTFYGGNLKECVAIGGGCGTVFEINSGGTLTTLYDFCSKPNCADGAAIFNSLALDNGNFYGATWGGGSADGGTIFRITPAGKVKTLYTFCDDYPFCSDGDNPIGPVLGNDGSFYGTTYQGAAFNAGGIFKMTSSGTETTIYSFCTQLGCTDGLGPRGGIILDSDGNFYGPTLYGGPNSEGTVFQVTPAGVLTTLHSFDGSDGYYPIGGLSQGTTGVFYGITPVGGSSGDGTIFSLSIGLSPFVETAPIAGKVGTKVIILGNKLKGATSVTFNGKAAVFKVVSSTEITATVPRGATTGPVKVTTTSGALTSNVNFQVMP